MNIESLEDLWNAQRPTEALRPDPAELGKLLSPELRHRRRMLSYEFFCLALGLVLTPLLAVVNYLHKAPENPILYWFHAVLYLAVAVAYLIGWIRRWRRQRQLTQTRSDTVAAFAAKALAAIEAEMKDYRAVGLSLAVWFGLAMLSVCANHPVTTEGWGPLGQRAGLVLALFAVIGAADARHYYKNLVPERARRQQLLNQLS